MTPLLRIEMILIAIAMIAIVIFSVNRKKMRIQYSLVWILFSVVLLIIAIFPGIVFLLCDILDIKTPSNLIYLIGILSLFLFAFSQTIILSKQSERIQFLLQFISLEKHKTDLEKKNEE